MAPAISINLLAIVSFALFYVSLTPIAANALSVEPAHVARGFSHAHAGIAKKKRDGPSKRCKPRPSSSTPPPASTPGYTPAYTPPSTPSSTDLPTTTSSPPAVTPSSSPSSTTTTSSPPAGTPASNGAKKVGVSWSNGEETSLCNFASGNTYYLYNWKSGGYGDIVDPTKCGFLYIPQCWGPGDFPNCINDIHNVAPGPIFFLNEPDQGGQANTDVGTAVGLWFQYFQPLASQGYELVSPACTNSPDGFNWIQEFVSQVEQQGGSMSGVSTHLYSTDLEYSISFLQSFIAAFPNNGIWVTEYACQDYSGANKQLDYDGVVSYMTGLSEWMFQNPSIVASFAFGYFTGGELQANNVNAFNALIGDNDEPTQLGYDILNPS